MFRSYEWMIALRFLKKGKGQTVLIILGIAMGVAVQFFLSSLMSGLQTSLVDKTVGSAPHITVLPADSLPGYVSGPQKSASDNRNPIYSEKTEILSWQQYREDFKKDGSIKSISPTVNGSGFIERGGVTIPVVLKGVTDEGLKLYKIQGNIVSGKAELSGDSALFGKKIADRLSLSAGDKLNLKNDRGEQVFVQVNGIFDIGSEGGNGLVFLSLDRSRSFLRVGGVSSIEVQVFDVFAADRIAKRYATGYTRVKLESWQSKNRELLQALSAQSSSTNTILFFVIISISLGIASVLGIAAVQKQRQLGILKAMGTSNNSAAKIFIYQGFTLGLFGSFFGVFAGLGIGYMFVTFAGVNFGFDFSAKMIITPVILACLASTLASLIPARRAAGLSPIEVIRNG